MGTPADVVTTQGAAITSLIAQMTKELETTLGRKVESFDVTTIYFYDGYNCEIYGNKMYLKGIYRDLYSITTLLEDGTAITESTGSAVNGYKLDARLGIIRRIGSLWLKSEMFYKITGKTGLADVSDDGVRSDIKQLVIEMVAAKSGLWRNNVTTGDGNITTIRTNISQDAKDMIERFKLRDV